LIKAPGAASPGGDRVTSIIMKEHNVKWLFYAAMFYIAGAVLMIWVYIMAGRVILKVL